MRTAFLLLCFLAGLAACTGTDRYPVTGAECGPDDPVRDLDTGDCTAPGQG